jgi:hypothetical protein
MVTMRVLTFRLAMSLLLMLLLALVTLVVDGLKLSECGEGAIELFDGGGGVVCARGHVARVQIELRLVTYVWW